MANKDITVSQSSTGRGPMSDGGYTPGKKGDVINWKPGPGVREITLIEEKEGSDNIFRKGHPYQKGNGWTGTVDAEEGDYIYSISWVTKKGGSGSIDPVIAIRPGGTLHDFIDELFSGEHKWLMWVLIILSFGLLGVLFWYVKKDKE